MHKWLSLVTALLLIDSSVEGWHGSFRSSPESEAEGEVQPVVFSTDFPLNPSQEWFVDPSYLLWRPVLADLDYGGKVSTKSLGGDKFDVTYKVKEPDFDWNSGVRVGLGKFLPNHDKWDISFYSTYFYGEATDSSHGNINENNGFSASYGVFILILSEDSHCLWRLNYFVEDLILGRQFLMTPKITFHPYIGLRGAWMYTHFKARHFGDVEISSGGQSASLFTATRIKLQERYWGVGPRIGSNFDFAFSNHWSLLGNLAFSLLYGHYHVNQKAITDLGITTSTFSLPASAFSKNRDASIRGNIEGFLGLGWESWFRNETVRFAPALLFEGSLWFNMNDFSQPADTFSQNHGSLGFMGLTFNFLVDF